MSGIFVYTEKALMNETFNNTLVTIPVPEMTIEQYAQQVGVTARTVEGWIAKGLLPTVKIGKRRLVNMAARTIYCIKNEQELRA